MAETWLADRQQVAREVVHWVVAASRLRDLEHMTSPNAWAGLEHYLGIAIRARLLEAISRLEQSADALYRLWQSARTQADLARLRMDLIRFRNQYLRTETTLDFYNDAINTRSTPYMARLLRACDLLARRSMDALLSQLQQNTPLVLTYIDKGLGASILKMGLRLWDGNTLNPAAVIKVVFHNLLRPTSLIHEAGHQVAHITGWNEELADALLTSLRTYSDEIASTWASWASEIAADAFAFVNTGYASVAGLHDVLSSDSGFVFRFVPGDPHPIGYIRVLLGSALCRLSFGMGAWDDMETSWTERHGLDRAERETHALLAASRPVLPRIAAIIMQQPLQAFGNKSLTSLIDPRRVHPRSLSLWTQEIGPSLYHSPYWLGQDPVRILALAGYNVAIEPTRAVRLLRQQEEWMLRLGTAVSVSRYQQISQL